MLLALVLACAKHGDERPYAWDDEDEPGIEEDDPGSVARGSIPPVTVDEPEAGSLTAEEVLGTITRQAVARLDPKGGTGLTGTVTFLEVVHLDMDDMPGMYPEKKPEGVIGELGGEESGPAGDVGGTASGTQSPAPTTGTMPGGPMPDMDHHRTGEPMGAEEYGTVHVTIDLQDAPPGDHAVVIHERGDCTGPDAANVGNRFDPLAGLQGTMGQPGATEVAGPMEGPGATGQATVGLARFAGDLGNVTVGSDGRAHKELTTAGFTLGTGARSVNGLSVVVHEGRDDGTQPSGNVGKPIACGVVSAQVAVGTR